MKDKNEDITKAMDELTKYLESRMQIYKHKMEELHKSHEYLTDDEVVLVINLAKLLASMDYGIDTNRTFELHDLLIFTDNLEVFQTLLTRQCNR